MKITCNSTGIIVSWLASALNTSGPNFVACRCLPRCPNPEAKAILEKLTMEEAIALRAYTGDGLISEYKGEVFEHALYSNVNRSLYTNNEEDQQKFDSFIETNSLEDGLRNCISYSIL